MEENITMSQKELLRIKVLSKVLEGTMKQVIAANLLNLTTVHINRIIQQARKTNIYQALAHKNRGNPSNRKLSNKLVNKIVSLYKKKYYDFGPTFACEKLLEIHNVSISKESLRHILINHQIPYPARKAKSTAKCHVWRERKHNFGQMIQLDGSHHRWFENRLDQEICLMIYIDDATNDLFARFYEYEGIFPALDSLKRFVKKYGIPRSIYADKHSTYKTTRQPSHEELLKAERAKTQFAKVCASLRIELIPAHSPQAKGRVERSAETLQDRLIKELRLNNISSIPKANAFLDNIFLPNFNRKFKKRPKSSISLFEPVPKNFDYKWTFVISEHRTISSDFTISWKNRLFLLLNRSITMKRKKVLVKQALDGDLQFATKDKIIRVHEITEKDLQRAKHNQKQLAKLAKHCNYKKAKKSWMDKYYIATNRSFYS
ncbi:ISNCY family transposase [bacterium]